MTLVARPNRVGDHPFGWRPDMPDPRDLRFRSKLKTAELPAKIRLDLRKSMPPVYDQAALGSCTANAIAGAVEYDLRRQRRTDFTPSRLFIYWNERFLEGDTGRDAGAMIRDGVKVVHSLGAPSETDWPYDVDRFAEKPVAKAFEDAAAVKVDAYQRVTATSKGIWTALAEHRPVVFGTTLFSSFESTGSDGLVPMPDTKTERVLGGHAMLAVGRQTIGGTVYLRVRNSWSPGWGDAGYCWMPEAYFDSGLVSDCWLLTTVA